MYTLYHGAGSCSFAVKAALALTGTEFTTNALDMASGEHMGDIYKRISPLSKVPALALSENGDDHVLTEGSAILLYLAAKFPKANLMPEAASLAYGNALKWMQMLYATAHPHWGRVFFPERYGNDVDSIRTAAESEIHKVYALIEAQLGEKTYVGGDQLTLADLYLMVSVHWEGALKNNLSQDYPNLSAYRERMYQAPVIGEMYRSEFGVQ